MLKIELIKIHRQGEYDGSIEAKVEFKGRTGMSQWKKFNALHPGEYFLLSKEEVLEISSQID